MAEPSDMLGKNVVIRGRAFDTWRGRAIAYIDRPSLLIEQENGFRLVLPFEWAELESDATPKPDDSGSA